MEIQIKRRDFLAGMSGALGGLLLGGKTWAEGRPPNIVLILIDDLGWRDLGCYGGEVFETPNIDRLAGQGLRFTQAYSNCPVCSPSRAAILTGKSPARLRFSGHITAILRHRHPEGSRILPPDDRLYVPYEEVMLPEALKPAGYVSANIGKWNVGLEGYWPEDQGFDINIAGWTHGSPPTYFDPYKNPEKEWNPAIPNLKGRKPGEYLTDRLTDESIQFIEAHKEQPFFLYLPYYAVHTPLEAPAKLVEKYTEKLAGRNAGVDPVYAAMVEIVDRNVGRLMDTLDRLNLTENTAVLFFSDNGGTLRSTNNAPLREGKGWLYEGGIRVPLIIKWPGHVPEGGVCHEPVIGSDLYPTIVEMVGDKAKPGDSPDGVDLAPLWRGKEQLERDTFYWYYPHYNSHSMQPCAAIRKGDYKLIEYYDPPHLELYNIAQDLSEKHDLAEKMPEKAAALLGDLHGYLARVHAQMHTLNPERKRP
ncbi:MAG: sulfatase [bacterium]